MKCPWCGNTLIVQYVHKGDISPEVDNSIRLKDCVEVYRCQSCSVTGEPKWWQERIKDCMGMPRGDR